MERKLRSGGKGHVVRKHGLVRSTSPLSNASSIVALALPLCHHAHSCCAQHHRYTNVAATILLPTPSHDNIFPLQRTGTCARLILSNLGVVESVVMNAWYIRWQRRQIDEGEDVQIPKQMTQAIQVVAPNFVRVETQKAAAPRTNR